jgi:hypothetical protein
MKTHSIFSRQWWAVSLRSTARPPRSEQRLHNVAAEIARATGGSFPAKLKLATPGVLIVPDGELQKLSPDPENSEQRTPPAIVPNGTAVSVMLVQSGTAYFPLAEESLEQGGIAFNERDDCERDFPRRVKAAGNSSLYQYPLVAAVMPIGGDATLTVVSSPYFLLLREVLKNWRLGKLSSICVGINVEEAFKRLNRSTPNNGSLNVRSGRMVIRGIDNLRSAVFTGTNVIASSLYTQLTNKEGVTVHPKDCRLRRDYHNPVGGNRRPFVAWFDANGNFRFTPGADPISTTVKFLELLNLLESMRLVRDAETFNPLDRVGASAGLEST